MELEDNEYESLLRQFQPRKPVLPPGMESTRRHRPRLWLAAAAAVVFVAGLSAVVLHDGGKTVDTSAVLESVDGAVYRIIDRHPQIAKVGARVEGGEVLRTSVGAGAVFALADGTRVEMRSESELFVEPAEDGMQIRLSRGGIIVSAARQGMGHLYVQTKDVTVSVVGTVFLVNAEVIGSRVAVIQGEVHVRQGSKEETLLPGEQVATSSWMRSHPVSEEIAWSRSKEAHLALLQQSAAPAAIASNLVFETASIRPEPPGHDGPSPGGGAPECQGIDGRFGSNGTVVAPQGRCIGEHISLLWLIGAAYDLDEAALSRGVIGSPDWADDLSDHAFQLNAKAENPATATKAQLRQMLRALLADRFKLKVSWRPGEIDGYVLSVGKGGAKLKEASGNEALKETAIGAPRQGVDRLISGKGSIAELADFLSHLFYMVGPVSDTTELKGTYDFNIPYYVPPRVPPPDGGAGGGPRGGGGGANPTGPYAALAAALHEKLGLQLERAKVPYEFMVIDHVEKPSEN